MEEANALCDEILIIDKGEIISQGTPEVLLDNHFGHSIIQIPSSDLSQDTLKQLNIRHTEKENWVEFQTPNQQQTIEQLLQHGISLNGMRIRTWSLEDLFLALTGEALRP